MQADLFSSIEQVKQAFRTDLEKGDQVKCPCCFRKSKIYKLAVHSGTARQLIRLYQLGGEHQFIHITRLTADIGINNGGNFSITKHWGLTKQMEKDPTDKKRRVSGYWKLTPLGVDFVKGIALIPARAIVLNKVLIEYAGDSVSINECLGKEFSYQDLMAA
jgi:hypothetical protein